MKKVTVVVPVYNVFEYLRECLDSIVNQTIGLKNIEVIIINDGSKDNSDKIITEYAKKYPDWVIITRENKGISISRNEGIERATGEYLMFLDSDDYLETNALKEMYLCAKKENSDILVGRMKAFDSKGFYGYYSDKIINDDRTFTLKENKRILKVTSVCCKLYKTSFIKKIHFIPNIRHEDNYFSVASYVNAKKITTTNKVYYLRRYREGENLSFMQNLSINNFYDLVKNYEIYFGEYEDNCMIMKFSLKSFCNYIISRLPQKDKKTAREEISKYLNKLLNKKRVNLFKYYFYSFYWKIYYFFANIYYNVKSKIKKN